MKTSPRSLAFSDVRPRPRSQSRWGRLAALRRAYTLVELTVVIMIGMIVGSMVLALANQQFAFLRIFRTQNFLIEEAPVINNLLARLVGRAERFRVHRNTAEAAAGTNPVLNGGSVVALIFRQPDGSERTVLLSWEVRDGSRGLYYYTVPALGALGTPDWAVTKRPTNVTFAIEQGILRTTLTGPAGESITYSGTMQQ